MGAWESDPFGNDTACDWNYDLENKGYSFIIETLQTVIDTGAEYLESDVAEEAVAAADTLARLKGLFYVKNAYTESVDKWVTKNPVSPTKEDIKIALKALERIKAEDSELKELWEEAEDPEWLTHINSLEDRLKA